MVHSVPHGLEGLRGSRIVGRRPFRPPLVVAHTFVMSPPKIWPPQSKRWVGRRGSELELARAGDRCSKLQRQVEVGAEVARVGYRSRVFTSAVPLRIHRRCSALPAAQHG